MLFSSTRVFLSLSPSLSSNDSQLNLSNANANHGTNSKQRFTNNGDQSKKRKFTAGPTRTNFVCNNASRYSRFSLTSPHFETKFQLKMRNKRYKKRHRMSDCCWAKAPMKMGEAIYRRFLINLHRVSVAKVAAHFILKCIDRCQQHLQPNAISWCFLFASPFFMTAWEEEVEPIFQLQLSVR